MIKIKSLHIYPIKSCGGIELQEAEICETGFKHDRQWMLVSEKNSFLSQREVPTMALIQPQVHSDFLEVCFADQSKIELPLYTEEHHTRKVQIWKSECLVQDYGDQVAQKFTEQLGTACRLVTMDAHFKRKIASSKAVKEDSISFADGYPYLLTSQESLDDLNERLDTPISIDRFRPNIVIEGCQKPFEEDDWKLISFQPKTTTTISTSVEAIDFFVAKSCARCTIITVDQSSAQRTKGEPLRTLAGYRTQDRQVLFGQNLQHDDSAVGQAIQTGNQLTIRHFK